MVRPGGFYARLVDQGNAKTITFPVATGVGQNDEGFPAITAMY